MNRKTIWKKFAGVTGALSLLVLAACGANDVAGTPEDSTNNGAPTTEAPEPGDTGVAINVPVASVEDGVFSLDHSTFLSAKTNVGDAIEGGILNFGLVQNNPAAGILNAVWGTTVPDTVIRQFFDDFMYEVGEDLQMNQDGVATWIVSEDGRTFTWTINENAYWSDGEPLTARDWAFAFEVIAHPDYTGVRFDQSMRNIVGIEEFHNGEADYISGLRILDDRTLEMEFIEASPSLLSGGIWASALPYHLFSDIPVGEMQDSELIRENPIGFGPFVLDSVVPGEQWSFSRNENYWRGRPNLDGVVVRIIHNDVIGQELRAGNVDIINSFAASRIPYYFDMTNVEWIGAPAGSYSYISFNLGDLTDGEVIPNPDRPGNNVHLRRAIWHAADWDEIGRRLFSGVTWSADGIIPTSLPFFHAGHLTRPEASIEAARAELEVGGFIDLDGDGFVENPDGSPLVLQFYTSEPQSDAAEAHLMFLIQSWHAAGINVELNTPEFVALTEMLTNNEPSIDMFMMGWGLGVDVDPSGRYGRFAAFNRAGYVSEELDALLEAINTVEAMDPNVRRDAMMAWQEYMLENVVVIPTQHSMTALPVNNRVLNFDLGAIAAMRGNGGGHWYQVALSSETGIVDGQ